MHLTKKYLTDTKVQLTLIADPAMLEVEKQRVFEQFARGLKVPGFRQGKVPASLVEKHADPARLQSEFLDHAVNRLYTSGLDHEKLHPVAQPSVKITKFVPYDTLEVEAEVEVVGEVKLPDYKKMKFAQQPVAVEAKEVTEVIESLRTREAQKQDVDRASKDGDQVWIDFTGTDAKTKESIKGADGKDYPLVLGSNTFIPGFEPELVGLKAGAEKTFVITFPKDYGVSALQSRKVSFAVTVNKVQEVVKPKLDDELASKVGPFKTVADLKSDIKKELTARKEAEANQAYNDELVKKIADKAKVGIPEVLITEQIERIEQDQRQSLMYRGQTWQEFLEGEGLTEETYRKQQRPMAELRVKAGLVLSQIAEDEGVNVTTKELDEQMELLKARYPDPAMQAELAKPEARRDIASRILVEKTVAKLREYAK